MSRKDFLIEKLQLQSHPEGGFYRETYRSKGVVDFGGERNFSTCIYFMLTSDGFSAFHRIRQDEIWHFYEGSAVLIHMISPEGDYSSVRVGADLAMGEEFHFVVPAEYWFAAEVLGDYALVGCTVAPGFDFRDFELASRESLMSKYPTHKDVIEQFTR